MKRAPNLIRHILLLATGFLISHLIQSHSPLRFSRPHTSAQPIAQLAEKPLYSAINTEVSCLAEEKRSRPKPTASIRKRAEPKKPTYPAPIPLEERYDLAEQSWKESHSSPSLYHSNLIHTSAQQLAKKYRTDARSIERFIQQACKYQYEVGIPAPVLLAIALKESSFKSQPFRKAGNPFGIKASANWDGATCTIRRNGKMMKFRKYASPEEAVLDFGKLIRSKRWYADALNCSFEDFEGVVKGLERSSTEPGYATDPNWGEEILALISDNDLEHFSRR